MRIGLLPLGRSTFDVEYAEAKFASMLSALERLRNKLLGKGFNPEGFELLGERNVLYDEQSASLAVERLSREEMDCVLVLQLTFTDASTIASVCESLASPLAIWAPPEPRIGGRLRLNAFCGLNLASHALGLRGRKFSWLYADPDGEGIESDLRSLLEGKRMSGALSPSASEGFASARGERIAEALRSKRIARIGERPAGFDTCDYSAERVEALTGARVEAMELSALFDSARALNGEANDSARAEAEAVVSGLDRVDAEQLNRSLRLRSALEAMRSESGFDAFALRCWPEAFTEYGGAVCAPAAMMGEAGIPCACEADVYGALSQLALREAADAPVFLTDLVDVDSSDGTVVAWHCGQAPASMRDPQAEAVATIHTNRKMPLLFEFPLKPGRITLMRISQGFNHPKLILSAGEMLRRPMSFTGTSGVFRPDSGAEAFLSALIDSGLEHHLALAYGDFRDDLRSLAAALKLPVLEI